MQSLFNYIISTKSRYNNKVNIGNKELIINTEVTERDYIFVNRIGTVVNTPASLDTIIKKNDEVIVHHNVFRRWIDQQGIEKNSSSFIEENKYFVNEDQIFAYKRNNNWECLPNFCFVKPLHNNSQWSLHSDENLKGILTYSNNKLSELGASIGDIVGFTPDSEYEFNIDGQKLYRILSNHITINYGSKKKNYSRC
tara:strand:+ start:774 stop:1361 length:588 start_codon:yes stop_codon:yes gene_type:complete